ncbi:E3 ubiquitin ligase RNF157 isoform X1 [Solea senegalensis]|uniref:E3 ubiquitin-protein ligase n=1 Tax=Solea senegalensis TaxID=28829 RepID=A0AAV6RRQ1_SOLSE|nr:E3 ubiquitin ligase RNF157 isoform X3 [Solea senegalensis]KAG7507684.1 E3 ubiquitin ligase RNF157 isoform X1 [Solea senegalensis]
MGALTSRQNIGVEEVDIPSNAVYRYPPKSGSYFANHFIMGGEKFDSTHPEGYLFGENTDLNFLGTRPVAFPYAAPPPQEPVKTLRSLINIRKDTVRLVRCSEDLKLPGDEATGKNRACYNVEFTFDADTQVAITIYYQAIEEFHNGVPVYLPQDSSLQSETVHFKKGVCQQFCLPSHTVNLSEWADEELLFDMDKEMFPMVVQAVVDEGEEHLGHSHILLATFEKHMDGSYCVKPLKQKQVVDGVSYLLQEIYGIENKYNSQESKVADYEISDNSAECVVCLADVRDTLILPCRHLCLCNACAVTLRYQANCCPICRLPFRALLQIRAMRKKLSPLTPTSFHPVITSQTSDSEEHSASEHIPPGYEVVSLLEALNGPLSTSSMTPPPLHSGPSHVSGTLPPYSNEPHPAPARSLSPLDHSNSSQGLKLKKSGSKSLSQNSSVLPEEEDEKSCSESEACRHKLAVDQQECGVTPDSENLTLSSSGAIDQSSCTGTPLSSTITSPEGSYLAGVEGEPGGEDGGEGEENQDTPMERRGPLHQEGDFSKQQKEQNYLVAVEEQDSEGNDMTEEDCSSPSIGKGGRSRCPELANNNQGVALCDTPSLGLDNEQATDSQFAGLMYLGGYRPVLEPLHHHASTSNINLEEQGADNRDNQSPKPPRHGPLSV